MIPRLGIAPQPLARIQFRIPALSVTRSLIVETELRRSPRVPFIAAAEIMEANTQVRLSARTSDISRHGCYMDMVNPLPPGVAVKIAIAHGQRTFSATAGVVYSQAPLGMGLEFRDIDKAEQDKLEHWLAGLA
jgi:PilZ domain